MAHDNNVPIRVVAMIRVFTGVALRPMPAEVGSAVDAPIETINPGYLA